MLNLVADWWDWIYVDLLDRSTALMIFVGFELFMLPILFLLVAATALVHAVSDRIRGR